MGNSINLNDLLSLINNGEPVSAGVTNRPIAQLDQRTRYLWSLLQASAVGSAIIAPQMTVVANAVPGSPVFFNAVTQQFELCLAGVQFDSNTSQMLLTPAAQVWGVVYTKLGPTLADIVLSGYVQLDLTAALDSGQTLQAGQYFLSRTTPGKLIFGNPPLAVPVIKTDGNGGVFISPQWPELNGHSHVHFSLRPIPAGTHTPPAYGDAHVITDPNPAVEGWLPANHAIFAGKAPHDAKFGYNLSANAALKNAWPPLPPENAVLIWDGVEAPSGTQGNAIVIFDRNGIWWLSDCYQDVPWDATLSTNYEDVSESVISETPEQCPFDYQTTLELWFTRMQFQTDQSVVTSLVSNDERVIVNCATASNVAASVGPLAIGLNLSLLTDYVDPGGYIGVKGYTPATQTFHFGPIASGVYTTGTNVTLSGDAQTTEVIDAVSCTIYHGRINVQVATSYNRELFPDLVRIISGPIEQYINNVMYLSFISGKQSAIRVRFPILATLGVSNPTFQLNLRLLGFIAGTLPPLAITMMRVPAAASTTSLPNSSTAVTFSDAVSIGSPLQYIDVPATPFTVAAGDDLFFTIQREASDGYAGELGILRISGYINAGA